MRPRSIASKLALLGALSGALGALGAALMIHWLDFDWALVWLAVALAAAIGAAVLHGFWRVRAGELDGLALGLERLGDGDFSAQLTLPRDREFAAAVSRYNDVTNRLREDRQRIYQRELLLDTLVRTSPAALVLIDSSERVVLSNASARRVFNEGARLEGMSLDSVLAAHSSALRDAIERKLDAIVPITVAGAEELHHCATHLFQLNARQHRLVMLVELTQQLTRQEIATWKSAIRVISHEINNALAPVKSLAHSGQRLLEQEPIDRAKLKRVLTTVEERARHLSTFIVGYAEFARLPKPRLQPVSVRSLIQSLDASENLRVFGDVPDVWIAADAGQIELVLLNLLKNARESGSAAGTFDIRVRAQARSIAISVRDRGTGFSEHALKQALLPFFSTKPDGTGLGLALSREIIDAHAGRITLANRTQGGASVTIHLTQSASPP